MTLAPFISLDGIDGTGKSTQCRLLVDWLNECGIAAVGCADPGGTPLGTQLREILLASKADITARAEAMLFMASRAELVAKVIRPTLESGRVVVSDRFVAANVVYQGHAQHLIPDELWKVGLFSTAGLLPDLTLILDLPVEQAIARRGRDPDRMEARGIEFLVRVREGFRKEALSNGFTMIDASPDVDALHRQIVTTVREFLRGRGIEVRP